MVKWKNIMLKEVSLVMGMVLMSSEAFCAGTITENIVSDLPKHRESVSVYLKGGHERLLHKTVTVEQHHMMFIS